MKIIVKNEYLVPTVELLLQLTGAGRQARALSKFKRLVAKKQQEFIDERLALFQTYCVLDKEGNLDTDKEGNVRWASGKKEQGKKELDALFQEETIIDLTEFENYFDPLVELLETSQVQMDAHQVDVYDQLLETLEHVER